MRELKKGKNIGELSEFYSFVYILGNQMVELVNGELQPLGKQLRFLNVYRSVEHYELNGSDNIISKAKGQTFYLSRKEVQKKTEILLSLLKSGDKDSALNHVNDFMQLLHTSAISAKSEDKLDFAADVVAESYQTSQYLGFSVKSHIAGDSTLINCNGEKSAFQFEVTNKDGSLLTGSSIQNLINLDMGKSELFRTIIQQGFDLRFIKTKGEELETNLRMVDSSGPELLAELLKERYQLEVASSDIMDVINHWVKRVGCSHPLISRLGSKEDVIIRSVQHKIQNILLAFSTGATISTIWDGQDQSSGGLIVVTHEGQVVCLELFTRNAIGTYLLNNTYFDSPSSKRHPYGKLYREGGRLFVDMQLQVRFRGRKNL